MKIEETDARFYVVDEADAAGKAQTAPLNFDAALEQADHLVQSGGKIRVLYTEEASQSQISRLAERGLPASLVSGG